MLLEGYLLELSTYIKEEKRNQVIYSSFKPKKLGKENYIKPKLMKKWNDEEQRTTKWKTGKLLVVWKVSFSENNSSS